MKTDRATGYLLVSPAFLIIFLAMIAPLFFGLVFSLFDYQFGREPAAWAPLRFSATTGSSS